ncbi:MopE-related protein [Corallococcus sp. AB038B]|uniref:MopE-related protein n=1 Tax=Corallococcus sp. AB038B TaxID=2316718 RepID=UPI001315AC9C
MQYADERGIYGPCEIAITSKRACSCGATGQGTQRCLGNGSFDVCRSPLAPRPETCNACDDDLDGVVDNIAPQGCTVNKPGACSAGRLVCTSGAYACEQVIFPTPETCDGTDSDCDGVRDEDEFGRISCGVGECHTSKYACQGGAWQTCVPLPPSPEVCDGRDNDCDSVTDEGLGTLSCGQGQCAVSVPACQEGHPQTCVPLTPEPERCDGRDNDCDSAVDEDNVCRFDDMSCGCTPIPQSKACASTTCGVAPDGCGGSHDCGACLTP